MQKFSFSTEQWGALTGRAREAIATDFSQEVPGRLELAELCEVEPETIDRWEMRTYENTRFPYPSMTNMLNLCTLMNFHPAALFFIEVR